MSYPPCRAGFLGLSFVFQTPECTNGFSFNLVRLPSSFKYGENTVIGFPHFNSEQILPIRDTGIFGN